MSDIDDLVEAIGLQKKSIDDLVKQLREKSPRPPPTPDPGGSSSSSITTPSARGLTNPVTIDKLKVGLGQLTKGLTAVKTVGGASLEVLDELGTYGKDKYDVIQESFGGLGDGLQRIQNDTSRSVVDSIDAIYEAYFSNSADMSDFMVETRHGEVNAMYAFFDNEQELARSYYGIRQNMAEQYTLDLNKMSKNEQAIMSTFSKGLRLSNREVAEVMQRQIALTGEASNDMLEKISAYAQKVADSTGVSFQEISGQIVEIITDVETFGNVTEEQAARIAGNLNQIGLSVKSFGQMVDKFSNFDSAAESLGNLTTVFGVHFDAMEMMMLANEDQEEFLHRMRESFLDAGMAVEDMTRAEKKLAAQQMSMSIQEFETFMQEGRMMDDLAAETAAADPSKGFETMTKNMVIQGKKLDEMTEHLQRKVFDSISREAYKTGNAFEVMKGKLVMEPEKYLPEYEQYFHSIRQSMKATAGTEEQYSDMYLKILKELKQQGTLTGEAAVRVEEIIRLNQELGREISAIEMIEISLMAPNEADFIMKESAKITAAGSAIGNEIGKKIEAGIPAGVRPQMIQDEIEKGLRDVVIGLEASGGGGSYGKSPSPGIGIPIMHGIVAGFTHIMTHPGNKELIDEGLASFGSYISTNLVTSVAGSENPLIAALSEGDTSVTISSEGVISDIVEQLKISQGKSDEVITKMKTEEAENLRIVSEALQENATAVKAMSEKETTADISVNLDTGTLVRALKSWKGSDGTFIKFVVPR